MAASAVRRIDFTGMDTAMAMAASAPSVEMC
jgi:hypothetical protein